MATGIASAVFTAVNGSISSLNIILDWASNLESFSNQYVQAGETIRNIREIALIGNEQLEQWREYWGIRVTTKYAYQRELWGDTQLGLITNKISTIKDLCSRLVGELQQFSTGRNTTQLLAMTAQRNSSISLSRSVAAIRQDAEDNVKDASGLQILLFVKNVMPQAKIWQSELKDTLAELWDIADKAFLAKHGENVSDRLTPEQMEKMERLTCVQMAVDLRSPSEELYRLCLEAKNSISQEDTALRTEKASTRLKIDLTGIERGVELENIPSQQGIQLLFHLVLEWKESPEELCIEGPIHDLEHARNIGSFTEAYNALLRKEEATILIQPNLYFPSREPHDNETIKRGSSNDTIPLPESLAELLHALDEADLVGAPEKLPRIQRVSLAFKVAECGLFLAGTSWLSNLRSSFIRRSSVDSINYCFTLDVTSSESPGNPFRWLTDGSELDQNAAQRDFKQLAIDIFSIGIMLLELGTGKVVRDVRPCRIGKEEYFMCESGVDLNQHGRWMSRPAVMDAIGTSMGEPYASATAHCFVTIGDECRKAATRRAQSNPRDTCKKIFERYFLHVYTP